MGRPVPTPKDKTPKAEGDVKLVNLFPKKEKIKEENIKKERVEDIQLIPGTEVLIKDWPAPQPKIAPVPPAIPKPTVSSTTPTTAATTIIAPPTTPSRTLHTPPPKKKVHNETAQTPPTLTPNVPAIADRNTPLSSDTQLPSPATTPKASPKLSSA